MNRIANIKKRIASLEAALSELKSEVALLEKESSQQPPKQSRSKPTPPTQDELKGFYDDLYSKFLGGNSKETEELLKAKSVAYLGAFCKANNLPIDIKKVSKEEAISSITQWLAQRKAITQKAR
jgi:hypothetical protein